MKGEGGQGALLDSILFLVIMLVASTLVYVYGAGAFHVEAAVRQGDDLRFASDALDSVLASSLAEASYKDIHGREIQLREKSVSELILSEFALRRDGVPASSFQGPGRIEESIEGQLGLLVAPQYHFALHANYLSGSLFLSDSIAGTAGLPHVRTAASTELSLLAPSGVNQAILVTLYLWRSVS